MRVLVGVEDSEGAEVALRWAAALAADTDGSLLVAESWQYPPVPIFASEDRYAGPETMDERVTASVGAFVERVLGEGSSAEPLALRGPASQAVRVAAAERDVDVVVVGARSRRPWERRLLGSTSRNLVEDAPCPVVVVPEGAAVGAGPLVVGIDGSPDGDRALDWAAGLAAATGDEVLVVHCAGAVGPETPVSAFEKGREVAEQLLAERSRQLEERGVTHRTELRMDQPRGAIDDVAEANEARLVVVGARGGGAVTKLLLGSVSSYLVTHATRPIAVVPLER